MPSTSPHPTRLNRRQRRALDRAAMRKPVWDIALEDGVVVTRPAGLVKDLALQHGLTQADVRRWLKWLLLGRPA